MTGDRRYQVSLEELRQLLEDGILQPFAPQPKGVMVVRGRLDVIKERCQQHDVTLECFQAMEILFRANVEGVPYPRVMDEEAAQGVSNLIKDNAPKLLFEEWAEMSDLGGGERLYQTEDGRDKFIQIACGVSLFGRVLWEDSGGLPDPPDWALEQMEAGNCPECDRNGVVKTPDGYRQCPRCGFALEVR